jgi:5-bromo-4-chloroindolyl phosphate hydrolysis protein
LPVQQFLVVGVVIFVQIIFVGLVKFIGLQQLVIVFRTSRQLLPGNYYTGHASRHGCAYLDW